MIVLVIVKETERGQGLDGLRKSVMLVLLPDKSAYSAAMGKKASCFLVITSSSLLVPTCKKIPSSLEIVPLFGHLATPNLNSGGSANYLP